MRQLILLAIVAAAVVAIVWTRRAPALAKDAPQLAYITTAHQQGVVGYRDPAGAISPDGTRFAYSEGRFIRVIPIGGLKEKLLAAHRAGLTDVIIPKRNEPDLDDLPESVRRELRIHPVADVAEVLELALEPVEQLAQAA